MKPKADHGVLYLVAAVCLVLGLLMPAPAGRAAEPEASAGLGRVDGREVTTDDVRAALAGLSPAEQARVSQDAALLTQVVRASLVQKLVLAEAHAKNWEQSPGMQAQIERVRENALTESYLRSLCQPPDDYPSEAELQAAYDTSKPSLLVPRTFHLAQIFIALPKEGGDAALKKAHAKLDDVRRKLLAPGADFAAIAKADSEEPQSASLGGEIGWLAETQIQPEIRAQLPKLSLNIISEPVQLSDGWHVFKVLDAREPYTPILEQVRSQLREQLRTERTRTNTQTYLAKLMEAHPVTLHETALSKAAAPVAAR